MVLSSLDASVSCLFDRPSGGRLTAASQSFVGRLDAGHAELVLVEGRLRWQQKCSDTSLSLHQVAELLDESQATHPLTPAPPLSVYASFQYATIPEELMALIENEPNTSLQSQMRQAIAGVIGETLIEFEPSHMTLYPQSVSPELARLKTLTVPFETSGRRTAETPDDLREAFYVLILDIEFFPQEISPICPDVTPCARLSLPTEVGYPITLQHVYLTYNMNWSKLPVCESTGGFQIATRAFRSIEATPVIVIKLHQKSPTRSTPDRTLGVALLPTHELVGSEGHCQRLWKSVEPLFVYELLPTVETPEPVARFPTAWRAVKFLEDHGLPIEDVARGISKSVQRNGAPVRLDFNWSIRVKQATLFWGELYFITRLVALGCQPEHHPRGIPAMLQEVEMGNPKSARDAYGGPLLRVPYNPNLPIILRLSQRQHPLSQVEFEALDYEDIRRQEHYSDLLSQKSLYRWQGFLLEKANEGDRSLRGSAQWAEIEKATQAMNMSLSASDYSWMTTINDLAAESLPRFLVEVWCGELFCGELLLPQLPDLRRVYQSRTLFRLQAYSTKNRLSRLDNRKLLGPKQVRSWIYMQPVWRIVNSKTGRFSLAVRELRDISTYSHSVTEMQSMSPQVKVYKYDPREHLWTEAMIFTPFEVALYFLSQGQAERSMGTQWEWDINVMQEEEPDWKNFFAWDEPGRFTTEEREVAVALKIQYRMHHKLKLQDLAGRQNGCDTRIWRLCKSGIPPIMRPYVWTQISGAYRLRQLIDSEFLKLVNPETRNGIVSAYEYITKQIELQELVVFNAIREDVATLLQVKLGSAEYAQDLMEVLCALMWFCSVPEVNSAALRAQSFDASCSSARQSTSRSRQEAGSLPLNDLNCEPESTGVGQPLAYSKGLARIAACLLLDFNGLRIPNEDAFYILYALLGAGSKTHHILKAPFQEYFSLYLEESIQKEGKGHMATPEGIPYIIQDLTFVRAALELLQPDLATILRLSGAHIEELFYGHMNSLFAGFLPSQSLFRLWDLLMNVVIHPGHVIELESNPNSGASPENNTQSPVSSSPTRSSNAITTMCQGNQDNEDFDKSVVNSLLWTSRPHQPQQQPPQQKPREVSTADSLGISFGRRILMSFVYGVLTSVLRELPPEPSPVEIRTTLSAHLRSMRDSTTVVNAIDRGYLALFHSKHHLQNIQLVSNYYLMAKNKQLDAVKRQNRLLQEMSQPWLELHGHDVPTQLVMYTLPKLQRGGDIYKAEALNIGLRSDDLRDHLYPALKYHALFAPPSLRDIPSDAFGRIIIKLDEMQLFGTAVQCAPIVTVGFADQKETHIAHTYGSTDRYVWRDGNIFYFLIRTPPPYKLRVKIRNDDKEVLLQLRDCMMIKKLATQGECFRLFGPEELVGHQRATLNMSWYMYARSARQFMPGETPRSSVPTRHATDTISLSTGWLGLGTGSWGDLMHLNTLHVGSLPFRRLAEIKKDAESGLMIHGRVPSLHEVHDAIHYPATHGANKQMLDDLFFHTAPALLPYTEFGGSSQELVHPELTASVALRELLASLVIMSRGTVLDKATLLFDLYGHHDESRGDSGQFHLYYDGEAAELPPEKKNELRILSKFLPTGALSTVVRDERTLVNCISLAEAVACTQCILRRSCIHVDNLQALQLAATIFEPNGGRVPRLLGATLATTSPKTEVDDTHDPNNPLRKIVIRKNPLRSPKEQQETTTIHDVTLDVLQCLEKTAATSGILGFDFALLRSLEDCGIPDPFPEQTKTLRVAVSTNGSFESVEVISIEVDEKGNFWTGSGGNVRKRHVIQSQSDLPAHLRYLGFLGPTCPTVSMNERLADAAIAFDIHSTVIDKTAFVTRLLQSDLLSECLRRPTSFDRSRCGKCVLALQCDVPISFTPESMHQLKPLSFKVVNDKRKSKSNGSRSHERHSSLTHDRTSHPQDVEEDYAYDTTQEVLVPQLQTAEIHASLPPDHTSKQITITVDNGFIMGGHTPRKSIQDMYCKFSIDGTAFTTTPSLCSQGNVTWNQTFMYKALPEMAGNLEIEVWSVDPSSPDEYVGGATASVAEILQAAFQEPSQNQTASSPVSAQYVIKASNRRPAGLLTFVFSERGVETDTWKKPVLPGEGGATENNTNDDALAAKAASGSRSRVQVSAAGETATGTGIKQTPTVNITTNEILQLQICGSSGLGKHVPLKAMGLYCVCSFDKQRFHSAVLQSFGIDPQWNEEHDFHVISTSNLPCLQIQVYMIKRKEIAVLKTARLELSQFAKKKENVILGITTFDLSRLDPTSRNFAGDLEILSSESEVLGTISIRCAMYAPPSPPYPGIIRFTLEHGTLEGDHGISALRVGLGLSDQHFETPVVYPQTSGTYTLNTKVDFHNKGEHYAEIFLLSKRSEAEPIARWTVNLWNLYREETKQRRTTVEFYRKDGSCVGTLSCFMELITLKMPWPQLLKLTAKRFFPEMDFNAEGCYMKLRSEVKEFQMGAMPHSTGVVPLNETLDFLNCNSPTLACELWSPRDELYGTGQLSVTDMLTQERKEFRREVQFQGEDGRLLGRVAFHVKIREAPPNSTAITRCRVTLHKLGVSADLSNLYDLSVPYVITTIGDHSNRSPIAITGTPPAIKWKHTCVLPYREDAVIKFEVYDSANRNSFLASASVNTRDLPLEKQTLFQNLSLKLANSHGNRAGKLSVTLDFFGKPVVSGVAGIRIGFREGTNLGGTETCKHGMLSVYAFLNKSLAMTQPAPAVGFFVDFADQEVFVDWPKREECELLRLEVRDKQKNTLVAYQNLYIWDMFRDPYKTVVQDVPMLTPNGATDGGQLTIALQLCFCKTISHANESVAALKAKLTRACAEAASQYRENQEVAQLLRMARFDADYNLSLVTSTGTEIVLDDDALLSAYSRSGVRARQFCKDPLVFRLIRCGSNTEDLSSLRTTIMDHGTQEHSIARFPFHLTTFPTYTTKRKSRSHYITSNELQRMLLEIHPQEFVSVQNLAWVKVPTVDSHSALFQGDVTKSRARKETWVPALWCGTLDSTLARVLTLDFLETKKGTHFPESQSKMLGAPPVALILSFLNGELTPRFTYEVGEAPRAPKAIGPGSAPWSPPAYQPRVSRTREFSKTRKILQQDESFSLTFEGTQFSMSKKSDLLGAELASNSRLTVTRQPSASLEKKLLGSYVSSEKCFSEQ